MTRLACKALGRGTRGTWYLLLPRNGTLRKAFELLSTVQRHDFPLPHDEFLISGYIEKEVKTRKRLVKRQAAWNQNISSTTSDGCFQLGNERLIPINPRKRQRSQNRWIPKLIESWNDDNQRFQINLILEISRFLHDPQKFQRLDFSWRSNTVRPRHITCFLSLHTAELVWQFKDA